MLSNLKIGKKITSAFAGLKISVSFVDVTSEAKIGNFADLSRSNKDIPCGQVAVDQLNKRSKLDFFFFFFFQCYYDGDMMNLHFGEVGTGLSDLPGE